MRSAEAQTHSEWLSIYLRVRWALRECNIAAEHRQSNAITFFINHIVRALEEANGVENAPKTPNIGPFIDHAIALYIEELWRSIHDWTMFLRPILESLGVLLPADLLSRLSARA